jgi:hypothetical protein
LISLIGGLSDLVLLLLLQQRKSALIISPFLVGLLDDVLSITNLALTTLQTTSDLARLLLLLLLQVTLHLTQ